MRVTVVQSLSPTMLSLRFTIRYMADLPVELFGMIRIQLSAASYRPHSTARSVVDVDVDHSRSGLSKRKALESSRRSRNHDSGESYRARNAKELESSTRGVPAEVAVSLSWVNEGQTALPVFQLLVLTSATIGEDRKLREVDSVTKVYLTVN